MSLQEIAQLLLIEIEIIIDASIALIHQRQRAPASTVLLHPVAGAIVAWWLLDGARMLARRIPVRWGGRAYILEPRE